MMSAAEEQRLISIVEKVLDVDGVTKDELVGFSKATCVKLFLNPEMIRLSDQIFVREKMIELFKIGFWTYEHQK